MALQQAPELRDILSRFYQALETGDGPGILEFMSREQGALSIGTDPAEWWDDAAALERVYSSQPAEMRDAGVHIEAGEIQCYRDGNVGWCADQPRFSAVGREQRMRITAVFHKEGAGWKVVQSHASFGVKHTDALGTDLTT